MPFRYWRGIRVRKLGCFGISSDQGFVSGPLSEFGVWDEPAEHGSVLSFSAAFVQKCCCCDCPLSSSSSSSLRSASSFSKTNSKVGPLAAPSSSSPSSARRSLMFMPTGFSVLSGQCGGQPMICKIRTERRTEVRSEIVNKIWHLM